MSNPEHLPDATPPANHKGRSSPTPPLPGLWKGVIAGLAALLLIATGVIALAWYADRRSADADRADATLAEFAAGIAAACAKNPAEAKEAGIQCGKAREIDERPAGEKGDPGAKGEPGDRGPKGDPGATGPRGPQGVPGLSPPCLLQANRCVGATGAPGAIGPRGPAGPTGPPGLPGKDGADGAVGPAGPAGADGADGKAGADGADGATGPAGPAGPVGPAGEKGEKGDPGPACPEGSTLQKQQVVTTEAPAGLWMLVCVLTDQDPEGSPDRVPSKR